MNPLAEGVELVRARAVDAVHPGAAEALGDERGLLLDVHVDDVRPGFVGQYELAAGIEGAVPRVVGVARGVGGGAVAAVAEREDHPGGPDGVEGAVEHVVPGRADHRPSFLRSFVIITWSSTSAPIERILRAMRRLIICPSAMLMYHAGSPRPAVRR